MNLSRILTQSIGLTQGQLQSQLRVDFESILSQLESPSGYPSLHALNSVVFVQDTRHIDFTNSMECGWSKLSVYNALILRIWLMLMQSVPSLEGHALFTSFSSQYCFIIGDYWRDTSAVDTLWCTDARHVHRSSRTQVGIQ